MHLIWWIVVGLIAGWVTGKIMGGTAHGFFVDILIGIAGAIVGGAIMRAVGFRGQGGLIYTVVVAIGGAVILTAIYRAIFGHKKRGKYLDRGHDNDLRRAA